jgi:multiple sugar transport system substrate-binding protein
MSNVNTLISRKRSRREFTKDALLGGAGAALALSPAGHVRATENVEITSWCVSGPRFETSQLALIPLFNEKFPNYKVNILSSPWGEFYQKVSVALASGATQYDTVMHDYGVLPAQAGAGWLVPIDEWLDSDPEFKENVLADIPKNVMDLYRYKGELYGLPPDANLQLMYYRGDVLEQAGIAPPDTWDDVLEAAKELHGGSQFGFSCSLQRGIWSYSAFGSMLMSYGGQVYDEETFEVTVNSEPAVKALTMLKALMAYADPVTLNATNDDIIRSFGSGNAVLAPCEWGGAGFTSMQFSAYADRTIAKRVPRGDGPGSGNIPIMGGLGFEIPLASEKKDEVWNWIKFVLSDDEEVQETWARNSGQPTRLSSLEKYASINPMYTALADSLPVARPYPNIPEGTEIMDKMGTEVSLVMTGDKSPEEATEDMESRVTEVFRNAGYL